MPRAPHRRRLSVSIASIIETLEERQALSLEHLVDAVMAGGTDFVAFASALEFLARAGVIGQRDGLWELRDQLPDGGRA
jgi:hypothetical protein